MLNYFDCDYRLAIKGLDVANFPQNIPEPGITTHLKVLYPGKYDLKKSLSETVPTQISRKQ